MRSLFTIALGIVTSFSLFSTALGDSPITSTHFAVAYSGVESVEAARASGVLTPELANVLSGSQVDLGTKAAIINALSWDAEGKSNAKRFVAHLLARQGTAPEGTADDLILSELSGDEIFSLGYLMVMDDYHHPEKGLPYLERAALKQERSLTAQLVLALTRAQLVLDDQSLWCQCWRITDAVESNPQLKRDLRPQAVDVIIEYMKLYGDSCTL